MDEAGINNNRTKKGLTLVSVLLVTFGGAGLLFSLFPVVRSAYYGVLNGVLGVFVYALKPLFNFVEGLDFEEDQTGFNNESEMEEQEEPDGPLADESYEQVITSEHLMIGFLIIVAIIIAIILYKNKDKLMENVIRSSDSESEIITETKRLQERKLWKSRYSRNVPNDDIRKAFYKLEKWSVKKGVGRYMDESIKDWLQRYQLNHVIDDEAIQIYRDVRYGNHEIEQTKKKHYIRQIDWLKNELKKKLDEDK